MATAIAGGRVALGLSVLLAPAPGLRALGFPEADSTGRTLAQLVGTRDIALGLVTMSVRDNRSALRAATAVSAFVDAGDALLFSLAGRDPAARRAGLIGAVSGSAAALAGLWVHRRV
jgi:hypothetical protein